MMEMEWQPIETAPKDYTPILLFIPGDWETPSDIRIGFWKRDGFRCQIDDHIHLEGATHWAPLPALPTT